MRVIIAIKSLKNNAYFCNKANQIFSEIIFSDSRPKLDEMPYFISGYDAVIIGAREKISREVFDQAVNPPKLIGTLSIGLDHIDVNYLNSKGVAIINSPTANVLSVAEHVIALVLSLSKRIKEADYASQNDLGRKGVHGLPSELFGKTLGLIGYGKIAKKIVQLVQGFGMNVIATSNTVTSGKVDNIHFYTLKELISKSDIISINVPLNPSTTNLINARSLEFLNSKAILINTSRSEIVDYNAIHTALQEGKLIGYAEDSDCIPTIMKNRNNVVWTPHIAGLTHESDERIDNELIDRIQEYISKKQFK